MNLLELRSVYEEITEKQEAKEMLYHNYLYLKQNSSKQEELMKILQAGIAAYEQEGPKVAYSIFSKAIDFEADADAYYNRGTVCMDLRELRHAIHDFTAAIIFCPTYGPPYQNRGLCFAQVLADNRALSNPQYGDIKNFAKADLTKAIMLGNTDAGKYLAALG